MGFQNEGQHREGAEAEVVRHVTSRVRR